MRLPIPPPFTDTLARTLPGRFVLLVMVAAFLMAAFLVRSLNPDGIWRGDARSIALVSIQGVLATALLAPVMRGRRIGLARLGLRTPLSPAVVGWSALTGAAFFSFNFGLIVIAQSGLSEVYVNRPPGAPQDAAFAVGMLAGCTVGSGAGALAAGLAGISLIPLAEEFLYRGLLMRRLQARFGSLRGLLGSALLFSLAHLASAPLYNLVGGIVFGLVYLQTRSLVCAAVTHASANLLAWAASACLWARFENDSEGFPALATLLGAALLAASTGATLWTLRRLAARSSGARTAPPPCGAVRPRSPHHS